MRQAPKVEADNPIYVALEDKGPAHFLDFLDFLDFLLTWPTGAHDLRPRLDHLDRLDEAPERLVLSSQPLGPSVGPAGDGSLS